MGGVDGPGGCCKDWGTGNVRPTVAVEWVSKVVLEAGNGALALYGGLAGKTHKCNHGQATILDFLFPGVIIPQLQGVKGHLVQQP